MVWKKIAEYARVPTDDEQQQRPPNGYKVAWVPGLPRLREMQDGCKTYDTITKKMTDLISDTLLLTCGLDKNLKGNALLNIVTV